MNFEWDENKNQSNLLKHKILFEDILTVFEDINRYEYTDTRQNYGENRTVTIGAVEINEMSIMLVVLVVHTNRSGVTRIISARKATKKETQLYQSNL